ncbi:F0F1 ATP synthase subunit B family protein [Campylobacter sp. RM12637]|uniref:F0F1 ATP synthase subunit B family protein n=1 Tax=Campylobacter sp. RM12637 TaxID=2735734 RepID=UPI003014CBEB|nr:F0F1 ATP synthase subunit B [Campylobacter sp. RM12637]
MNRLIWILLPTCLLASDTDIFYRTINFVIFAVMMYLLLAKTIKKIYCDRIDNIKNRLVSIEKSLDEAKKNKEEAIKKIEIANNEADKLIELAKEQAIKLNENILKDANNEIENMKKSYEEQKIFEEKKAKEEVVNELIEELLNTNVNLKQSDLLDIVSRKVS